MASTERSAEEVLSGLGDGLLIVALRALGSREQANDAVQETLVRVLHTIRGKGIPPGYSVEAYAYGTLRHLIADTHRANRRFSVVRSFLPAPDPNALDALVDAERKSAVARALRQLDPADRALLEK